MTNLQSEKKGDVPFNGNAEAFSSSEQVEDVGSRDVVSKMTERKILSKLDRRIVPMVMWIYLMNFMDRVAIGNARLYGMEEDLGLAEGQFQLAVSILFVTYCLFEAPSNMIIKRCQPARYLACLTILWGLVATFTAFVNNFAALVACRLLLGLFEAGFFPGIILYLSSIYNKKNIALRVGYFFTTSAISGAVGGLIAYGIGSLDGAAGWRGWRWIFLITGIPTVVTGFVIPLVLPNSMESAKFLTDEDRRNLLLLREAEMGQTKSAQELRWADVKEGMLDWKTYAYGCCQFCNNAMLYSFSVFLPTIIRGFGQWTIPQVQALTVPVFALGAITYLTVARLSDITQVRGPFAVGCILISMTGYIMLVSNSGNAVSFGGCFLVAMGCYAANGIPVAWLATNNPRYGKRAYASGLQLSIGNSAGVAAPFLFADDYAPAFTQSYGATIGLLGVAASLFTTLHLWYRITNKRRDQGKHDWKAEGKTEEEIAEMGEKSPRYRYTL